MNASRVIGPAIGGVLYPAFGAAPVFAANAFTYLFAVAAVWVTPFPGRARDASEEGRGRLLAGFRVVRHDPLVRRILTTMATMSLFSLAFVGLMPALAADNLGMRPRSLGYGLLYAGFGLGAALGAVSIGTLLAGRSKARIVRLGFVAFSVLLACFALVRSPGLAYPVAILLGIAYFAVVTSLSTVLQENLADHLRGRVMALWIMAFGGTVPIGVLAAGAVERPRLARLVQGPERAPFDGRDSQARGGLPAAGGDAQLAALLDQDQQGVGIEQRKAPVGHQAQQPQL